MTQKPQKQKFDTVLIVAIIGVFGTIIASAIGVYGNYNIEKLRQESELTKIALVSIATQGGATQVVMQSTINAPTQLPYPTYTPYPTNTTSPTKVLPTLTPTSSEIVLFQDNFDVGKSPSWNFITDDWGVIDGKLSLLSAANAPTMSIGKVGDSTWINYKVEVSISGLVDGWYAPAAFQDSELNKPLSQQDRASRAAVLVRVQENNDGIALILGEHYLEWAYYRNGKWQVINGTLKEAYGDKGSKLEIVVQGKTYTLKVNGIPVTSFTDEKGYDSGGVGIWLKSGNEVPATDWRAVPKIDDVIVVQLP